MKRHIIESERFSLEIREDGRFVIRGEGIQNSISIPSDEELIKLCKREGTGKNAHTARQYLAYRYFVQRLIDGENPGKIQKDLRKSRDLLGISQLKSKGKGNSEKTHYVTEEDVRKAFSELWPESVVKRAQRDEKVKLEGLNELKEKHRRVYYHLRTKYGKVKTKESPLKCALDKYIPGLYELAGRRTHNLKVDIQSLREELIEVGYSGGPLQRTSLERSKEHKYRMLFKKVKKLSKNKTLGKLSFNKVIEKLLGREFIKIASGRQSCAQIAEKITGYYIVWAGATAFDPLNITSFGEYKSKGIETYFSYDEGKGGIADGRIGLTAVEVKTESRDFLRDIFIKYNSGVSAWDFGPAIDGTVAFLFMDPKIYEGYKEQFDKSGIRVVGREEFRTALTRLNNHLNRNYSGVISEVRPKANLEYIVHIFDEVSSNEGLALLSREGITHRREYALDMMKALIRQGGMELNE